MNTALFSITVCFLVQSILPVRSKFFIIETEVGAFNFPETRESQSKKSYDRKIGLCYNPETMDKKLNMKKQVVFIPQYPKKLSLTIKNKNKTFSVGQMTTGPGHSYVDP